jgi:hypothetical protein
MATYKNSFEADGFDELKPLLSISTPQGTTGGTLAGSFFNKMNAFGAIIPGNERWWHAANERMLIRSAVQMTKIWADGLTEMARYVGPAGARMMWADIPGYNADRADLDLLDVVLDTYKDAKADVPIGAVGENFILAAATSFDIPMFRVRGNASLSYAQVANGHHPNGIYLPLDDTNFLANDYVLPMRLEFKLTKAGLGAGDAAWNALRGGGLSDALKKVKFGIVRDGEITVLTPPDDMAADKFFFKRTSSDPNAFYLSINLALADADKDAAPRAILADSKTDLYKLNAEYEAANGNPWPDRGKVTERGFFLFGDGRKDARFISPQAIYMLVERPAADPAPPSSSAGCDAASLSLAGAALALRLLTFSRKKA